MKKEEWVMGLFNRIVPVLPAGIIFLFFLPFLAGWGKLFFDDIAFIFYPQQVFLARCLGHGSIPWWEPQTCAGATPFYCHIFQSSLYPINWLFLLLGNIDQAQNFFWLVKMPLVAHYFFSAIFSYIFGRSGLRLSRAGSCLLALAYTLSPTMIYMSTYPPEVFVQTWIPLLCYFLIIFSRTGRFLWLVLGIVSFGIASTGGDVPFVFHVVMITILFSAGLLIMAFISKNWLAAGRIVFGGCVIFSVGGLLAGIYWSNIIDGLLLLMKGASEEVARLSGFDQSLYPLYLITLFIPDYFGGITSYHTWGAAFMMKLSLDDVNLLGGAAGGFLVFLGFFLVPDRKRDADLFLTWRRWWWLFGALFLLGIFVVLGAYTPVQGVLKKIIPVLRMPYPVRFRSIECFALAGLIGVSTSLLFQIPLKNRLRKLIIYVSFVVIFALLALLYTYRIDRTFLFLTGWRHLAHLRDWSWFLTGPVLYLAMAVFVLVFTAVFRRGRYLRQLLVIFVAGEIVFFAYQAFYYNQVLNFRYRDFYALRYHGPSDQPEYRKILSWRPEKKDERGLYRRLYFRSYFDNLAWLDGSLSILGFDIKPIDSRFQNIMEELTDGFPYEIKVRRWDSRFWPNMSARYILAGKPLSLSSLENRGMVGEWYAYEDPAALPRIFMMDTVVGCSEEEARGELMKGDLRKGVFVERSNQLAELSNRLSVISPEKHRQGSVSGSPRSLPRSFNRGSDDQSQEGSDRLSVISDQLADTTAGRTDYRSLITEYRSFKPDPEFIESFNELQVANPITEYDFSNPNRVEVDLVVTRPAMLVMTDVWYPGWRAEIDGNPVPLYRVNYLQRGVWCAPGKHRVIMVFQPPSLNRGIIMTGVGLAGLIALIIVSRRQSRLERLSEKS